MLNLRRTIRQNGSCFSDWTARLRGILGRVRKATISLGCLCGLCLVPVSTALAGERVQLDAASLIGQDFSEIVPEFCVSTRGEQFYNAAFESWADADLVATGWDLTKAPDAQQEALLRVAFPTFLGNYGEKVLREIKADRRLTSEDVLSGQFPTLSIQEANVHLDEIVARADYASQSWNYSYRTYSNGDLTLSWGEWGDDGNLIVWCAIGGQHVPGLEDFVSIDAGTTDFLSARHMEFRHPSGGYPIRVAAGIFRMPEGVDIDPDRGTHAFYAVTEYD